MYTYGLEGSFYGRSPDGHAIFPPHPLRFELKFAYLFSILGKVLPPIITSESLSDLENLDYELFICFFTHSSL